MYDRSSCRRARGSGPESDHGCRLENRHRVFALAIGTSGLALAE